MTERGEGGKEVGEGERGGRKRSEGIVRGKEVTERVGLT